jgi:hypothetical protein
MNRDPRNKHLLAQLSAHNQFKPLAARAFDIGSAFEKGVADVGSDGRLSPQGKREAAKGHLEKARADLLALQKPVEDYRRETVSLRGGMRSPTFDKTDNYAALLRREMRDRSVAMTPGQRAGLLTGPGRSVEFIDALLEAQPWVSGINVHEKGEIDIYEAAKQERLRDLNGPLLDALEARASVEAEITMVLDIVRGDIESAATQLAAARAA